VPWRQRQPPLHPASPPGGALQRAPAACSVSGEHGFSDMPCTCMLPPLSSWYLQHSHAACKQPAAVADRADPTVSLRRRR
jgi:hypothetical protein